MYCEFHSFFCNMASANENESSQALLLPSSSIPPNEASNQAQVPNYMVVNRPGFGSKGSQITLLANHFGVCFSSPDSVFYHYNVSIESADKRIVDGKAIGRKIMDKLYQNYSSELQVKQFAYDGGKNLFTVGPLGKNNFEFIVVLDESAVKSGISLESGCKRLKCMGGSSRSFKVEISFAAKIPLKTISFALEGTMSNNSSDALRVLDIILRQIAYKRGCLLVRQSFFHDDPRSFVELDGGIAACRGLHSSFCTTKGGLSMNMDVSTTIILKPGPVLDFLLANQNVRHYKQIDWVKAKKTLKGMRVKTRHRGTEHKIIGLSEKNCNQQLFALKVRNNDENNGDGEIVETTVYDYFKKFRNIALTHSAEMPCLDVGKQNQPNFLPLELCWLVSLQRYTKALSAAQKCSLVQKSRQKPPEQIRVITNAMSNYGYHEDAMLLDCGISIDKQFTQVDGRVLSLPKLKVGNSDDCSPRNGRWNFNDKRLFSPVKIENWAIVNFSARCDASFLSRELINCGRKKGINIERPHTLVEEDHQCRKLDSNERVERMFDLLRPRFQKPPDFLLCILPERRNSNIYGPWKRKNLHEEGIFTQCIAPIKINDQYLTNVLLKINSKLGGINSLLAAEISRSMPLINITPTLILGMDVSRSPGQSDVPSIAAVVGSRFWPLISRYRASVRTQSPKAEMIESLHKPLSEERDGGIIGELLIDFYQTSKQMKPSQIIVFRDGVSQSQFNQVLSIELDQIIKSFRFLEKELEVPKITLVVAQKNHHTKFFQAGASENVPSGTVVDTKVVHPTNYDFYMFTHGGIIGTSRPTHYHVLLNEIGFSPDELQELILSLSYVSQRSTSATSIVAPIAYAHLAAYQMSQFMRFGDSSDSSPGNSRVTASGTVPQLPQLHHKVSRSMFFC